MGAGLGMVAELISYADGHANKADDKRRSEAHELKRIRKRRCSNLTHTFTTQQVQQGHAAIVPVG